MSLWTNEFEPKTAHELLVNKSKIIEVKSFLDNSFIRIDLSQSLRKNILVIFGPNGAGKTTILRCLCNNIKIIKWDPPTALNEGIGASFYRFIFNSLFFSKASSNEKVLILIKDLPFTLLQHNTQILIEIRLFLSKMILNPSLTIPIVFIASEDRNDRQFLKLLLPGELDVYNETCADKKLSGKIKIVRLNPIPSTVIKSKLKYILKFKRILVGRNEENLIERIVQTSNGDLYHAVSQLQFHFGESKDICMKNNTQNLSFKSELSFSGKKRSNDLNNHDQHSQSLYKTFNNFGKEPMYNVFRTIGKILYNKREEDTNKFKPEYIPITYTKRTKMNSEFLDIYDNRVGLTQYVNIEKDSNCKNYCEGFKDLCEHFFSSHIIQEDSLKGQLSFDLEDLLLYSGVEDNSLILLLQENYIPFIGNCMDTIFCSDIFSWSDIYTKDLNSDNFSSSILVSCIARTILYFNSKPLNPCSSDYQTQDNIKAGFSRSQSSLWKKQECIQNGKFKMNNLVDKLKKTKFKWHPKKPAFKTFISNLEILKEDYKNLVEKCLPSFTEKDNYIYLLCNKSVFTEIFPYLSYFFVSKNISFTLNSTINNELVIFLNNWNKYSKYIPTSQLNFKDNTGVGLGNGPKLYCYDQNFNTSYCEYLSDEQLVSILETCDVENLQSNPTVNNCFELRNLNCSNNDIHNSISSSDESVDDDSE
ncbi:RAD24 RF-C activator 1 AAA+ ATPase [Cryptosporidium ubiquitum]|uniref:RAD24 RF-C activator 1 AAA+ ATPase n=1 Tax=Cryptosporidium ubiquitum TaxID=857276 RepID=A0A1J4MIP4_9CRYT|nr:RAD24 RF-C activator 1 AAA+ ATPase [Cryptosporidium ubiquitum]OII74138.1 RAD24 RF-C activator 1 AAA+ ATPase [Cryptosporidium ubiquitum]